MSKKCARLKWYREQRKINRSLGTKKPKDLKKVKIIVINV